MRKQMQKIQKLNSRLSLPPIDVVVLGGDCNSYGGEVTALVERYDAVKFGIFQRNLSNFRGLVLFCIEADFCNQILIF